MTPHTAQTPAPGARHSRSTTHGAMCVGLDGSAAAWTALAWAAAEATRTGATLVVAHAGDLDGTAVGSATAPRPDEPGSCHFGHELLADAVARLADEYPALTVHTRLRAGHPADVLADAAARCDLVVIGRSAASRLAEFVIGPVTRHVLASAPCPVVIVPDSLNRAPADLRNAVVVGVSTSTGGLSALRFAAAEARRRGALLYGVRAWGGGSGGGARELQDWAAAVIDIPGFTEDAARDEARIELDTWLQVAQREFPDVAVHGDLSKESIGHSLHRAAADAVMLVVGCRRDRSAQPHLGPVASWAVRHAPCPVAVVKQQTAAARTDERARAGQPVPAAF